MLACDLCGLDCGKHPLTQCVAHRDLSFCCLGCLNVYVILFESGVVASGQNIRETGLFKRSQALGLISQPGGNPEGDQAPAATIAGCEELLVDVNGMWCSSCAWLIEHVVSKLPGIVSTAVSFASDTAKIAYQPQRLPADRIIERINSLGYRAEPHSGDNAPAEAERRDLLVRTGLAFFFWLNIMTFSLAVYASYFDNVAESARRFVPFLLMALATPVVFYCAQPILRLAWRGLLNRTLRMESLLALGILSAYLYSCVQAFRGEMHVYFDTASAIVALVLAGKSIERNAKDRATRWLAAVHRLLPSKARLLIDDQERLVSVSTLQPGEIFLVKPGERIPADGIVDQGEAHVDESLLTGESRPVNKLPGSTVIAGSVSTDGVLKIQASKAVEQSTISQILTLVEKALAGRSEIQRTVDRVSRVFVPVVVLVALATFSFCWGLLSLGFGPSLIRSIAVLVIACPCALGLATPLAITAAIGAASRSGILISDSRVLETLSKIDVLVLDKTGTVTDGHFSLVDYQLCDEAAREPVLVATADGGPAILDEPAERGFSRQSGADTLSRLVALESCSEHPLAKALVEYAQDMRLPRLQATAVKVHKGEGITGDVGGEEVFLGNGRLLQRIGARIDLASESNASRWQGEGNTVAFFGWQHQVQGVLAFGDRLREEASSLVAELHQNGIRVQVVSGDSQAATEKIAFRIQADGYRAECLPEQKIEIIRELQGDGSKVAMVGDGINDAPALAQADLGIAMGSGTDVAMKAAAVVLTSSSLSKVVDIFCLAQKTMRVVRQNLFWAFVYNVLGISLAVLGLLNPVLAAGAMLLSSISVTANSLRLNSFGQRTS